MSDSGIVRPWIRRGAVIVLSCVPCHVWIRPKCRWGCCWQQYAGSRCPIAIPWLERFCLRVLRAALLASVQSYHLQNQHAHHLNRLFQMTCLFSSLALVLVILYIGPALEYLPKCILSTMIIFSQRAMFDKFSELRELWPIFKVDFVSGFLQ